MPHRRKVWRHRSSQEVKAAGSGIKAGSNMSHPLMSTAGGTSVAGAGADVTMLPHYAGVDTHTYTHSDTHRHLVILLCSHCLS